MKPNEKIEKEVLKIYDAWMHSYLHGDVETYNSFLDDDYHFIGSAKNEEFLNRKDTTQFFADTGEQFAGKTEIRNESKIIEQFGELIFVTHVLDGWFLNEKEWNFYSRFRFSSVLRKHKDGWRFIYQHFSIPDPKTEEGETIGYDKINDENQQLREAITRRTFELEAKNRELEIEGALERIRAQATAMKASSDLLDIVVTMRNEFIKLGHEAHYFWHMMWLQDTYEKAMTSGDGSKIGFVMTLPRHIHGDIPKLAKWEKSNKPTVVYTFTTEESIDYVDKMVALGDFKNIDPQAPSHDDLKHIGGLTFIMARTTHGEIGYSLPGIVKNPPKEDLDILVKFAGAFDLAHQRFIDLQKAEQQAREVEIELALEKLRSRTMAMQKSEELSEASFLLDAQIRELGIETWGCAFNIYGEDESKEWFGNEKGELTTYTVPRAGIFKEYYDKGQKGETLLVKEFSGEACIAHYEFMSTLPGIGEVLKQLKKTNKGFPTYQIDHVVYFKYGYLLFITREFVPEAHDIFKRFAQVFEQTYTRFLDLQKAEAQAREAQIEAALERIRAQSMAMHDSNELKDVIRVIFDQMAQLKINAEHAGIVVDYEPKKNWHFWVADHQDIPAKITVPYLDLPWDKQFTEAKKNHREYFTTQLNFEEKNSFYRQLLPHIENLTKEAEDFYFNCAGLAASTVIQKDIGLYIENFDGTPYSDEENDILLRFAKVVQQTYTRFLDLQKAEAQAREAQIIASIERVRASTMAMHHSDELSTVLSTLFEQFDVLGIKPSHAVLTLINQEKNTLNFQMTGKYGHRVVAEKEVDLDVMDAWVDTKQKWKNSKPNAVNVNEYPPETLPDMWELFAEIQAAIPKKAQPKIEDFPNGLYITEGYCKFGYIGFAHHRKPTEEEKDIVRRFAAEFGALYQRFLDLQKSEAQAREAQIEASLEKVRSRSLAMHKPEELQEVVAVVAEKLQELGVIYDAGGVILCTYFPDNKDVIHWITVDDFSSSGRYFVPYFDNPIFNDAWDSKTKGDSYFSKAFTVKAKNDFFKHVFKNSDYRQMPEDYKKFVLSANSHHLSAAWSKNSAIIIPSLTGYVPSESDAKILKRFAKVFEQAYIRFLDLQKAEAQAREAQIEAALEKIRSRSLAVHKSDEFNEVVSIVFEKLKELQIPATAVGIGIKIDGSKDLDSYVCGENEDGLVITNYRLPYFNNKISKDLCTALEKELDFYVGHYTKKVKNNFYKHILEHTKEFKDLPKDILKMIFESSSYTISMVTSKHVVFNINDFEGKDLTNLEIDIIKRFSKVFNQAYIRFLDLQKAEAQAREAQIEAALEKVRSRTMAMQKGEELKDVVVLLYKELIALGVTNFVTCGYVEINEQTGKQSTWVTHPGGDSLGLFYLPLKGDATFDERYKAWKSQEPVFHQTVAGQQRKNHLDYAITTFNSKEAEEMVLSQFPDPTVFYCFNFSHGYLHIVAGSLLKKDEEALMARFTKVFEQTYARFLDLKKAELQAREAQINLAVERVRAKALAMHKSEEIMEVVAKLKDEVMGLDIPGVVAASIFLEADNNTIRMWDLSALERSDQGYLAITDITFKLKKKDPHLYIKRVWENPEDYYVDMQNSKDLDRIIEFMYENNQLEVAKEVEDYTKSTNLQVLYHAAKRLNKGKLSIDLLEPPPEEMETILNKMGAAFDLAYKRFEDIKKAEAQAREAQIETALEKVRSRTMAMQKSDELPLAANNLFLQVQELGIPAWSAGYCIWEDDSKTSASCNMSSEGEIQKGFILPSIGEGYDFYTPQEKGKSFYVKELGSEALVKHYEFMKELPGVGEILKDLTDAGLELPTFQIFHICYFKFGYVMFITYEQVQEAHSIFQRFGKVFEQTYTRFLDLKRAEEQAREARIETALERVRSRSMGMQSTADFGEVTTEMFNQLRGFGEDLFATGIVFCDKHEGHVEQWHSIPGGGMLSPMIVPIDLDYVHQYRYDQWKAGEELFSIEIPSDFIEQHFEDIFKLPSAQITLKDLESRNAPMPAPPPWEIDYGASFKNGYVLISSLKHLENTDILPRFAKVFEQAYTRFLDLETAEKNAYKSKVETALERVRARALAMHEPDELKEVASVLRTEMGLLGIEELETCSIYILDDEVSNAECWYALKDSKSKTKKLISDHISMDFTKTWVGQQMLKFHDSEDENTSIAMTGNERVEWIRYCENQSKVLQSYYGEDIPERTYHLQKFSNGAIGAASAGDISVESWVLLKRCASVFSLAYSRFKDLTQAKIDLKRLKAEKKRAEEALSELQTTQKQLIQSEKMASLGELTAGIAHEIQNPLNFVNNFSEVSKELLEEMQEEIKNGDFEEVKAIMDDIVQNLEKINHHGKRADGIVKGMLQHSRSSGDKKEPTDINALADEYLRLAYHGLRAKDKSFNAELVTDFDQSIDSVHVVPQDIGRVVLNLLTNAFYVVHQKKQSSEVDFKPTVSIKTQRHKNTVEIKVTDNGNGMPERVKEKIFQPFFTTKPTGEGTGLGLSLSYDIITKGHGGNLTVKTEEKKGTTFCISLPIKETL